MEVARRGLGSTPILSQEDPRYDESLKLSKGQWMDNVFIERLWRSLKYECVYLNAFDSVGDAIHQIGL